MEGASPISLGQHDTQTALTAAARQLNNTAQLGLLLECLKLLHKPWQTLQLSIKGAQRPREPVW